METVEVVIKIPKNIYESLYDPFDEMWKHYLVACGYAIRHGTVLPKGHGRLLILDEEKVKERFTNFSFSVQDWISEVGISEATLKVIEADTESEDQE